MLTKEGMAAMRMMLRRDEGVRLFPYRDTVNKLTIGVGRNLTDFGLRMSEVNHMLENDIIYYEQQMSKSFQWFDALDEPRKIALINFCFNLGLNGVKSFKRTLKALEQRDFEKAAIQILNSKYATQVGNRAKRIAEQIRTGKIQTDGFAYTD